MPIRNGLFKSINRVFPYLGRGCVVVLAAVSIITAELSVSTTWSAASSVVSSAEIVNRAQKGDRLPLMPTLPVKPTEQIGFSDQALPVGCEGVSSPFTHPKFWRIARHCLS
jgi:hypothetical protein